MKYTLMHKNEPVANVDIMDNGTSIPEALKIINSDRLPFSIKYPPKGLTANQAFENWLNRRSVPRTRDGIGRYLKGFGGRGNNLVHTLSLKSLGLNLSDQYWFKPENSEIQWTDVNYFTNKFSGNPLERSVALELPTPDYCTNGNLSKYWTIQKSERVLLKAGKGPFYQQVTNEIIADKLLSKSKVAHVRYKIKVIDQTPWSMCSSFVHENTEFVPANEILHVAHDNYRDGLYTHFLRCMDALHIPADKKEIDTILQFDYLLNNTDRHYGNFGFIRDVNTLEFKGLSPIFDNGNSLWYDQPIQFVGQYEQKAMPFAESQEKQLKQTGHEMDWLHNLDDAFIAKTILTEMNKNSFVSEERTLKILNTVLCLKRNLEIHAKRD